jgi:hypothetical protein
LHPDSSTARAATRTPNHALCRRRGAPCERQHRAGLRDRRSCYRSTNHRRAPGVNFFVARLKPVSADIRTGLCAGAGIPPGKDLAKPETGTAFLAAPVDSGRQRPRYPASPAAKPRKVKDYSDSASEPATKRLCLAMDEPLRGTHSVNARVPASDADATMRPAHRTGGRLRFRAAADHRQRP